MIRLHTSAALAATLVLGFAMPLQVSAAAAWQAKVDPALLSAESSEQTQDFLIQLNGRADLSAARQARTRIERTRIVVDALKAQAALSQPALRAFLEQRGIAFQAFWVANVISARGTQADMAAIAARSEVEYLHRILAPQYLQPSYSGNSVAKAEEETIEPGLTVVKAPEVWKLGFRGQGVVVGDHDIGVQWDHPALINAYRGWDGSSADHRYNWHNGFAVDPFCTDPEVPCDSNGHGTHTTGTMVGDDGAGMKIGMAPEAKWMACRSLLDPIAGVGAVPPYLECMEWMLAPYPAGDTASADPAMSPDVVNNSWGCLEACAPPVLKDVNDATYEAGIVQVVSAGNDGSQCSTIAFPLAVYESSFTVGATNNEDGMASFSSRGPVLSDASMRLKPNVVAPGVGTLSSLNDGGYGSLSGTSMAGPHVAGQVALIMSAEPRLIGRVADIRTLIERTAVPIASTQVCGGTGQDIIPNNVFGYGRIDALASVEGRPQLQLTSKLPATLGAGQTVAYEGTATLLGSSRIDASGVVLTLNLPKGATLVSSSENGVLEESATGTVIRFTRPGLMPGAEWTVTAEIKAGDAGNALSTVEADQVSPVAGTAARAATVAAAAPQPSRFGGALGAGVLLLLAGAGLRRARR